MDLASVDDIKRAGVEANEWAGGCADILVNNGGSRFSRNYLVFFIFCFMHIPLFLLHKRLPCLCRERLPYIPTLDKRAALRQR